MRILFSTGFLNYTRDANTKIVIQIGRQIARLGAEVHLIGECTKESEKIENDDDRELTFKRLVLSPLVQKSNARLENYIKKSKFSSDRARAVKRFCITHPFSARVQFYRYTPLFTNEKRMKKYAMEVRKYAEKIKPDALVCVYSPFNYTYPIMCMASRFKCPIYLWQLDPWGLHNYSKISEPLTDADRITQELMAFEKAKHIFTTNILFRQYSAREDYCTYTGKMTVTEFPNITCDNFTFGDFGPIKFDKSNINLLFCGLISDLYRNPQFLLEKLTALIDRFPQIKVYFVGDKNSQVLERYVKQYPDNIFSVASVPVRQAFSAMEQADILINIGNTFDNQVPSKIFDYFSLGKPILTVKKIKNCPAQMYFEKYPLSFTLDETSKENSEKELEEFIFKSKGKHRDFRQVKEIFHTCTPEYVSAQIFKELSDN